MVERERGEGEAAARALTISGPLQQQQEGAAEGERGENGGGDEREEEEEEDDRDTVDEAVEEWSEIRLAIEELSPPAARLRHGSGGDGDIEGDGKAAASSPPTLRFLALSHLLLRVLGE